MEKEKIKENLKQIGEDALNDLEPVIKKGVLNIFNFIYKIVDESITSLFEKRKKTTSAKGDDLTNAKTTD